MLSSVSQIDAIRARLAMQQSKQAGLESRIASAASKLAKKSAASNQKDFIPNRVFDHPDRWQYGGPWAVSHAPTTTDRGRIKINTGMVFCSESMWEWPRQNVGETDQTEFRTVGAGFSGTLTLLLYVGIDSNNNSQNVFDIADKGEHPLIKWSSEDRPGNGSPFEAAAIPIASVVYQDGVVVQIDQIQYGQLYIPAWEFCHMTNDVGECRIVASLASPVCCPGEHDHFYELYTYDNYPYYPPDQLVNPCGFIQGIGQRYTKLLSTSNILGNAIRAGPNSNQCVP